MNDKRKGRHSKTKSQKSHMLHYKIYGINAEVWNISTLTLAAALNSEKRGRAYALAVSGDAIRPAARAISK
jgi:hypothetical protein